MRGRFMVVAKQDCSAYGPMVPSFVVASLSRNLWFRDAPVPHTRGLLQGLAVQGNEDDTGVSKMP